MSLPAALLTELTNLQTQVVAAAPIASASFATVKAMQLNAETLVTDVQSTLVASSILDTWSAPTDPDAIITGLFTVYEAATDQANLSLLRGIAGRVAANLEQLV